MDYKQPSGICGNFMLCIDSYHNNVPIGRLYTNQSASAYSFEGVTQCLAYMEQFMDSEPSNKGIHLTFDQSDTGRIASCHPEQQGTEGTFSLRILFRQNGSWQGFVTWLEEKQEQPFRSVLELLLLVDSALQGHKSF